MSAAGALWALIVASIITAGLNKTCQAYRDTYEDFGFDKFPCCSFYYSSNSDTGDEDYMFFYEELNTSKITAWIAMVLLLVLAGVYTFIIIRYFFGSSKITSSKSDPTTAKTNPI
ncbi:hypothetical protein GBAR_LOCUS7500 [Geodia barretti]|nr:hypothetical protein GBAR_LOCUS7500 [Geodia barretti]